MTVSNLRNTNNPLLPLIQRNLSITLAQNLRVGLIGESSFGIYFMFKSKTFKSEYRLKGRGNQSSMGLGASRAYSNKVAPYCLRMSSHWSNIVALVGSKVKASFIYFSKSILKERIINICI